MVAPMKTCCLIGGKQMPVVSPGSQALLNAPKVFEFYTPLLPTGTCHMLQLSVSVFFFRMSPHGQSEEVFIPESLVGCFLVMGEVNMSAT